jgi:hypothetical protein
VNALVAREGIRAVFGLIPYAGVLLVLIDSLMIFNNERRTWHDELSGTFVVRHPAGGPRPALPHSAAETAPRLSQVSAGTGSGAGLGGVAVAAIAIVGLVCGVGILSAIAIPNFITMQLKAKRGELPGNVDAIREAELVYFEEHGAYLPVSSQDEAEASRPDKTARHWEGSPAWSKLGWAPDGDVRGAYWVVVAEPGFVVHGICDVDNDDENAEYAANQSGPAEMLTGPNVF